VVGHLLEFRALDLDGEDAGEITGGFQPVGLDFELRGVADFFAGARVGDRFERERSELATGHRDELEGRRGEADEVLGVAVEHPRGEFARGRVAEQFEIVSVITDFDERAAVRRGVDVRGVSGVSGFFVVVVGLGTGGRKEGGADEGEEDGGGFHGRQETDADYAAMAANLSFSRLAGGGEGGLISALGRERTRLQGEKRGGSTATRLTTTRTTLNQGRTAAGRQEVGGRARRAENGKGERGREERAG
jgi:hypothetical protein